jgi:hypothetical protein
MKIRFQKNYSTYRVNDVVDCDEQVAIRLLADGRAVREHQQDLIETAAVESVAEQADATPRRVQRQKHELPKPQNNDAASG